MILSLNGEGTAIAFKMSRPGVVCSLRREGHRNSMISAERTAFASTVVETAKDYWAVDGGMLRARNERGFSEKV
jgi:hypothetical protein